MDSGFYAACTALSARSQGLDLIANNLANASTSGYRAQRSIFQSLLAQASAAPLSPLNAAVNNYGVLGAGRVDLSQGSLENTGNSFDLAIEGNGFFVVQTPSGTLYTRNGAFRLGPDGQLVTRAGDPVQGQNGSLRLAGGPASISQDGTISINGAVVGKLKVMEFPQEVALSSAGDANYTAPAGSERPSPNSRIQQGMLEGSNVNAVGAAVELIEAQRYFEMLQRALSMFHADMNRIATEDLPRVTG